MRKLMLEIKKEYIVDEENRKKAVLLDIEVFEKIEEIMESFGLGKYMEELEEVLNLKDAKEYYTRLKGS